MPQNPKTVLHDTDGEPIGVQELGDRQQAVHDAEAVGVLGDILIELKLIRAHLEVITDEKIRLQDVE